MTSLVLYRECAGAVVLRSQVRSIAGAFRIQLLAGSRSAKAMGIDMALKAGPVLRRRRLILIASRQTELRWESG